MLSRSIMSTIEYTKNDTTQVQVEVDDKTDLRDPSRLATEIEHSLTLKQAVIKHKKGVLWAGFFCLPNVIIGYDPTILGSLVAIPQFKKDFGYEYDSSYIIPAPWTSALNYAPIIGFLLAAIWGGWCVDRYGARRTLIGATGLSMATLFIEVFAESLPVIFVGDLLTGLITGSFPVLGPAYISEVLPVNLRGMGLAANNLAQVIGQFIGTGILKGTENRTDKWAYKVPFITEYLFPLCFLAGALLAPDSPWYLAKVGKYDAAKKALTKIGYEQEVEVSLAHIKHTIALEEEFSKGTTYLDCFKGVNLRRTMVCAIAYCGQFLCGINLASSYCTYFFEIAGLSSSQAFDLSLGLFGLGIVGNLLSWIFMFWLGRRGSYITSACISVLLMFIIGLLDLAPASNNGAIYAKSTMLLLFNFFYNCGLGPVVYVVIAELPSARLRGKTLGVACFVPHILSISITAGLPYAMNVDQANWGGKTGFLFAGLGLLVVVWSYFCLPESGGRTFEELDLMFESGVSSRKFKSCNLTELELVQAIEAV